MISDFKIKSEHFNSYFAAHCPPVKNSSTLPTLKYKTKSRLNSFNINEDDISLIIKNLDSSKAHGWDTISIRMIKLCGKSIATPLKLTFKSMLEEDTFPDDWKRSNVVPVNRDLIKNYRPISLLPIFSKILEGPIFDSIFNYFIENKLFTECQSGFIPRDSCISQLLCITHEIYKNFDCNLTLDTRATFLDISKAFDKVWHEGLIFKLQSYGIEGNLLLLLKNYLKDRKQRVVLNGQSSLWENILAGVPQGSVLGPLLFLIYINDLPKGITSVCKIFADDTSIFSKIVDKNISAIQLNKDLEVISNWAYQWKMLFNPDSNKQALEVRFSQKRDKENYP